MVCKCLTYELDSSRFDAINIDSIADDETVSVFSEDEGRRRAPIDPGLAEPSCSNVVHQYVVGLPS